MFLQNVGQGHGVKFFNDTIGWQISNFYNTSKHCCTRCHRFKNINDEPPPKTTRTTKGDEEEEGFGCSQCSWKGKGRNTLLGHSRVHKVRLLL